MLRKIMSVLIACLILLMLSVSTIKPAYAQTNTNNRTFDKPFYEKNLGNGKNFEIDKTGGGVRFKNGVRIGVGIVERPQNNKKERKNSSDKKYGVGIGINWKF